MRRNTWRMGRRHHFLNPMRLWIFLLIAALLPADIFAALPAMRSKGWSPPNFVVIVANGQGAGDFGFMGNTRIKTPNLDRLAGESAVFPDGYVPTALSRPSMLTILTGRYPHEHKSIGEAPAIGEPQSALAVPEIVTVPGRIVEMGYTSLQTGVWFEGHYSAGGFTHGMTETFEGSYGIGSTIGRATMEPITDFLNYCHLERRPFFLWYAPLLPAPSRGAEQIISDDRAAGREKALAHYERRCAEFDKTVGVILDDLDAKKLSDNTIVIFVVSNGWEPGERIVGAGELPASSVRSRCSPYEPGVRTPIVIRWPGRVKVGTYPGPVSTIDLAPTMFAACGFPENDDLPGKSLLGIASGSEAYRSRPIFGETYHVVATGSGNFEKPGSRWIRENDWKLIVFDPDYERPSELFNIARDPQEAENRIKEEPALSKQLEAKLNRWWPGTAVDN